MDESACNTAHREGTIASTIGGTIKSSVVEAFCRGKKEKKAVVVVEAVGDVGNPQGFPSPVRQREALSTGRHIHSQVRSIITCISSY